MVVLKRMKTENGNETTNHEIEFEVFHRRELFDLAIKLAQLLVNKGFEPTNLSERSRFGNMLIRKNNRPSPIKNSIEIILNLVDPASTMKRSHGQHFGTEKQRLSLTDAWGPPNPSAVHGFNHGCHGFKRHSSIGSSSKSPKICHGDAVSL